MATECNKLEITTEALPCKPRLLYETYKNGLRSLAVVLPEIFLSSELVEGDGESAGSVRLWNYTIPGTSSNLVAKDKLEVVDDENMCIVHSVVEGALVDAYTSFRVRTQITPNGEGSSVTCCFEYGECRDGVDDPHHYMEIMSTIFNKYSEVIAAGSDVVDNIADIIE